MFFGFLKLFSSWDFPVVNDRKTSQDLKSSIFWGRFSWEDYITCIIFWSIGPPPPSSTKLFPANWKGVKFQNQKYAYLIVFFWLLLARSCKVILPREVLPGHSFPWQRCKSNVQRFPRCVACPSLEQSNYIDHELQCLSRQVAKKLLRVFPLICSLCVCVLLIPI